MLIHQYIDLLHKGEKINLYLEVHNCRKNCHACYLIKPVVVTSILVESTGTDAHLKEYNIYFYYKVNFEQIYSYHSNKVNGVVQNILSPKKNKKKLSLLIFWNRLGKNQLRAIQTAISVTHSETSQFFL